MDLHELRLDEFKKWNSELSSEDQRLTQKINKLTEQVERLRIRYELVETSRSDYLKEKYSENALAKLREKEADLQKVTSEVNSRRHDIAQIMHILSKKILLAEKISGLKEDIK